MNYIASLEKATVFPMLGAVTGRSNRRGWQRQDRTQIASGFVFFHLHALRFQKYLWHNSTSYKYNQSKRQMAIWTCSGRHRNFKQDTRTTYWPRLKCLFTPLQRQKKSHLSPKSLTWSTTQSISKAMSLVRDFHSLYHTQRMLSTDLSFQSYRTEVPSRLMQSL